MKKILTLLYTNFIMLTRQRGLIISSLGLAVISMLVFGYLFGGSGSPKTLLGVVAAKDIRQIDIITPGMLGMLLMWANLAVGIELVNWREMGITKRLAATPLQPLAMISAQVVARLALSLIQGIILLALAALIFNVHIYGNIGLLALVVIFGALTLLAIGFAIASFVKKSEAANSVLLLVSFPMMFLGGSYFDVNGAPSFLQPLIHAMPLYYLNEALRQVINNGAGWGSIQTGVLVMLAWIVASMLVVWRAFKWL